jgi:predicted nucleic acid-binding protein
MWPAISNTSPLTNLAVIGRVELVRDQLGRVAVPEAVWREMLALPHEAGREALLAAGHAGWLVVLPLRSPALAQSLRLSGLDEGESEAIALAVESSATLLLIDEK